MLRKVDVCMRVREWCGIGGNERQLFDCFATYSEIEHLTSAHEVEISLYFVHI